MDHQTDAVKDRWLKEQVRQVPKTTACTVPKGLFGGGVTMLRTIARGSELSPAYPPRPTDPKPPWASQRARSPSLPKRSSPA